MWRRHHQSGFHKLRVLHEPQLRADVMFSCCSLAVLMLRVKNPRKEGAEYVSLASLRPPPAYVPFPSRWGRVCQSFHTPLRQASGCPSHDAFTVQLHYLIDPTLKIALDQ